MTQIFRFTRTSSVNFGMTHTEMDIGLFLDTTTERGKKKEGFPLPLLLNDDRMKETTKRE